MIINGIIFFTRYKCHHNYINLLIISLECKCSFVKILVDNDLLSVLSSFSFNLLFINLSGLHSWQSQNITGFDYSLSIMAVIYKLYIVSNKSYVYHITCQYWLTISHYSEIEHSLAIRFNRQILQHLWLISWIPW